ncbi:MAG: DNA repair protein RecO [Proteobacteria bacterium]|nr:DNA repair protein RecO [Pseudomonadota bacterium]
MTPADLGIVLRATPLRESDLLVVLYTETHGRVSAVARGARKSQRRFAVTLSSLVLARYQLGRRPRGDVWGLESGEVVREWTQLAFDMASHAHAGYAAELVGALLPAESPEPTVLPLVTSLWDSLVTNGPSPAALRAFELALMDVIGQRPALDACAACGSPELVRGTVFDPARGGVICKPCAAMSRGPAVRPLPPETLAYLRAISTHPSPESAATLDRDEQFTSVDRASARDAMVAMVVALVGHPLRSLEYIAKLGAAARRAPHP